MITPIERLDAITPIRGASPAREEKERGGLTGVTPFAGTLAAALEGAEETGRGGRYDFSDNPIGAFFQPAIDAVVETDAEKVEAEYLLATGQLDNPAELTTAAAKNQLAVELLVQLRNRALDAYSELTRLSI